MSTRSLIPCILLILVGYKGSAQTVGEIVTSSVDLKKIQARESRSYIRKQERSVVGHKPTPCGIVDFPTAQCTENQVLPPYPPRSPPMEKSEYLPGTGHTLLGLKPRPSSEVHRRRNLF